MKRVRFLRHVGLWEGVSYLVLLCVAMPLKYLLEQPLAVRVTGAVHGALFLVLVYALLSVALRRRWSVYQALAVLGAALIPFGPWFIDKMLLREIEAEEAVPVPE